LWYSSVGSYTAISKHLFPGFRILLVLQFLTSEA
jgi:hypothetical protein